MKTKIVLLALFVALVTMGFECINDPIIVAVNLDPVSGCWTVNTGDGTFNSSTAPINVQSAIRDNISESYRDKILSLRIYDIIVKVQGSYPTGAVTGAGFFRLDNGTELRLLQFRGQYSDYASGVSLFNPNFITPDNPNVAILVNAFSNVNNLPQTIVLRGAGSGPPVAQNFQLCLQIMFQAEAKAQ